jgi:hypothetical protein
MENKEVLGKTFDVEFDGESYTVVTVLDAVEGGSVTYKFSEVEESNGREINAMVDAVVHIPELPMWSFCGRLNIVSLSAREGFARQLSKPSKMKIPAEISLSNAVHKVVTYLRSRDESVWFENIEGTIPEKPLFNPFIIENAPNLMFGKGGTGKTYICLRLLLSLITGKSFLGFRPERSVKVLFVDYEASKGEFFDRFNRLLGGMTESVDISEVMGKIRYFPPLGRPMHEIIPLLKKTIRDNGIEFVLIDSAILACGGEPERAEVAARYFNALASLGVTTLTIAHETKAENHAYPFGSVVWWNSPRNIWNAQSMSEVEDEDADPDPNRPIEAGLFHRKSNNGGKSRMVSTRISFTGGKTSITLGDQSHWEKEVSTSTRILRFLRRNGLSSRKDIDEELEGVEKNAIKVSLRRLVDTGKVVRMGGQGGDYAIKT